MTRGQCGIGAPRPPSGRLFFYGPAADASVFSNSVNVNYYSGDQIARSDRMAMRLSTGVISTATRPTHIAGGSTNGDALYDCSISLCYHGRHSTVFERKYCGCAADVHYSKVKIGLRSLPAARISEFPKVGLRMIDSAGTWIRLSV